jgi:hypothetical protein
MLQQAQQQANSLKEQIEELNETATVEKVMKLFRDQKTRPFVLDIETDSTIAPDENAQKQRATEFITAVGGFMNQAMTLVQAVPQSAKLAAETLKYVASQFRAGRALEQTIEEFADDMAMIASQPKQDPMAAKGAAEAEAVKQNMAVEQARHEREQQAAALDQQRKDAEAQANQQRENARLQADMQAKDADEARKEAELNARLANLGAEEQRKAQEHAQAMDLGALAIEKLRLEIEGVKVKTASTVATTQASIEKTNTDTDNAVRKTNASVQATADGTAIKAQAAKAKEPA